jgi:hypothetical protein
MPFAGDGKKARSIARVFMGVMARQRGGGKDAEIAEKRE